MKARTILVAFLVLAGQAHAQETPVERVVSVDWGLAETLIALGHPPLGLPEKAGYETWVAYPPLPESVAEIGLRMAPNLEYLAALRPDLILATPQFNAIQPTLEQIAPVRSFATYTTDLKPYRAATDITRELGRIVGAEAEAQDLIDSAAGKVSALRDALAGREVRSVLVVSFVDDRHVRVFTEGSIYHDVMISAGLANAWPGEGSLWGFSTVSIDQFAAMDDVAAVVVEPVPEAVRLQLSGDESTGILGRMAVFGPDNYRIVPSVWSFGGLPSAGRFADLLSDHVDFLLAGHES